MDDRVHNAGHGEYSAHDRADVHNELEEVLRSLLVLHGDGRELIVEHQDRLLRVEVGEGVLSELVYLVP